MHRTPAILALVMTILIGSTACSRQLTGTAVLGPDQPQTAVTEDEFGVRAGREDAPVQLEIYTEPQCSHCADLQADFGDQLAYYIGIGELAVTYRPMTFLDKKSDGYSAHVATALFAAGGRGGGPEGGGTTPARAFQRFVEDLWAHQDPGGEGPSNDEMADMAKKAGVPDAQVQAIANGSGNVNTKDMEDTNSEFLSEIDPLDSGTPTVYDLTKDQKLDVYDNDWLSKVMSS
jgi:protein-disulfide isomerase